MLFSSLPPSFRLTWWRIVVTLPPCITSGVLSLPPPLNVMVEKGSSFRPFLFFSPYDYAPVKYFSLVGDILYGLFFFPPLMNGATLRHAGFFFSSLRGVVPADAYALFFPFLPFSCVERAIAGRLFFFFGTCQKTPPPLRLCGRDPLPPLFSSRSCGSNGGLFFFYFACWPVQSS